MNAMSAASTAVAIWMITTSHNRRIARMFVRKMRTNTVTPMSRSITPRQSAPCNYVQGAGCEGEV